MPSIGDEDATDDRERRRRPLLLVAALVVAVAATAVAMWTDDDPSPLGRARALVATDRGFDTGADAGATLAKVAQHLHRAVIDCREDRRGTRCQALSAALGYAQVLAPRVLVCTAPGRHEARTKMASYLDQMAAVAPDAARVPGPPELPSCQR